MGQRERERERANVANILSGRLWSSRPLPRKSTTQNPSQETCFKSIFWGTGMKSRSEMVQSSSSYFEELSRERAGDDSAEGVIKYSNDAWTTANATATHFDCVSNDFPPLCATDIATDWHSFHTNIKGILLRQLLQRKHSEGVVMWEEIWLCHASIHNPFIVLKTEDGFAFQMLRHALQW